MLSYFSCICPRHSVVGALPTFAVGKVRANNNYLSGGGVTFIQSDIRNSVSALLRSYHLSHSNSNNLWSVEECLDAYSNGSNISSPPPVFVDASWYHKGSRNGRMEYEQGPRIPGARYCDMEDISTSKSLYPDLNSKGLKVMLPPVDLFTRTMDAMNIQNDDQVIIYGREGCIFTPRTWYLFKTFGHDRVGLMQGSLEEWMQLGGPVETDVISYDLWAKDLIANADGSPSYRVPAYAKSRIVDMEDMLQIVNTSESDTVIVDTRGSSYAKGHMPGAVHVPYSKLVQEDNQLALQPRETLQKILADVGIKRDTRVVVTCGSGVSVCHMALALEECGYAPPRVYDGSWNEWGSDPNTPKVVSG